MFVDAKIKIWWLDCQIILRQPYEMGRVMYEMAGIDNYFIVGAITTLGDVTPPSKLGCTSAIKMKVF